MGPSYALPAWSMKMKKNDDFWRVYFEISKDHGKTWEVTDYINDGMSLMPFNQAFFSTGITCLPARLLELCGGQAGEVNYKSFAAPSSV